jgi:hypothetical protein
MDWNKLLSEMKDQDKSKMIWIFVSEDDKILIPFQGSEQEAYDYWDILAERGLRIHRLEHLIIQTAERNPYTPLL